MPITDTCLQQGAVERANIHHRELAELELETVIQQGVAVKNITLFDTTNHMKVNSAVTDVAFLGDTSGYFFAVDLSSGVIAWVTLLGGSTSPAVLDRDRNTVYTVCDIGQLYALSMRDGSILWSVSGLFNPTQFEVFGSLLLNSDTGNLLVGLTNSAFTGTNHVEKIVAVSTTSRSIVSQASLSTSNHPSQSGLNNRELALGTGSFANTLFVIGQKAAGPYTGLTSLCYSPYTYHASDLSTVATSQPFCPSNTNSYSFDYDGQVPLFFNSEGPAQQHSMCNMSLIAVKVQSQLVILNAKTMAKVQSYIPARVLKNERVLVNSPASWDPENSVLVVTVVRIDVIDSSLVSTGSVVGLKLGSNCQLRELWKTDVGTYAGGILGYPNFYSPVIVGPMKKRVVFAVSGNPIPSVTNLQLSLVALSLNNGRLLWTAEKPAASYFGNVGPIVVDGGTVLNLRPAVSTVRFSDTPALLAYQLPK